MTIHWNEIAAVCAGYALCALLDMVRAAQRQRHTLELRRVDGENERLAERTRAAIEGRA